MKVTINAGSINQVLAPAITEHMLKTEIAIVLDDMRTAAESQREYLIGELSALLWVQGGGDLLRPVAFQCAVATWDEMRKGGTP